MLRKTSLSQISSLGVTLPIDLSVSVPPVIQPILFFKNKDGVFLCDSFKYHKFGEPIFCREEAVAFQPKFSESHFQEFQDCDFQLVFIRREYDGSVLYYLVHTLKLDCISDFSKLIKETKGGILL